MPTATAQASTYRAQFPLPTKIQDGLCINFAAIPPTYDLNEPMFLRMKEAGFKWARQFCYRTDVQDANGRYDWTALDLVVNSLTAQGFRLIFSLSDDISGGSYPAVLTATAINKYARYCAEMAKRYSALGPIFEIWNEPDGNWVGGTADGVEYATMALAACQAIRDTVGENAYIAAPAVEVTQTSFITTAMSKGLGNYIDLCTVHSYRYAVPPETLKAALKVVQGIVANSKRNISVAISEMGMSSSTFNNSTDMIYRGTGYVPTVAAYTGSVTGATNATPIVITSAAHGLRTGATVTVASVGGNTAANGTWIVETLTASTYNLVGSVGNGAYTSGGTWAAMNGKNLLQWSEDLTNAIWLSDTTAFTKTRCAGPTQLPSSTVAWNLSRGNTGGGVTYGIRQSAGGVTLKGGNTYGISCWMRSVTGTHTVFLNLLDLSGTADNTAYNSKFTLTTEWQRFDRAFALPTATSTPQKLRIVSTGAAGETSDIQVCNLQCELLAVGKSSTDAGYRALQLDRQAQMIVDQMRAAAEAGVYIFGVYTCSDFTIDPTSAGSPPGVNHLGVLDYYNAPKPAYTAIQKFSREKS